MMHDYWRGGACEHPARISFIGKNKKQWRGERKSRRMKSRLFLKSGLRLPGELLGMSGGGKCGEEEEEDLDAFFSLPGSGKQFSILANAADWWQSNHKSFLSSFADEHRRAFANARSELAEVRGGGLGCSRSGRDRSERGSSA